MTDGSDITDEQRGMAWWNALTDEQRISWQRRADTMDPAAAWTVFKRELETAWRNASEAISQWHT
jgi:hypothetical protein